MSLKVRLFTHKDQKNCNHFPFKNHSRAQAAPAKTAQPAQNPVGAVVGAPCSVLAGALVVQADARSIGSNLGRCHVSSGLRRGPTPGNHGGTGAAWRTRHGVERVVRREGRASEGVNGTCELTMDKLKNIDYE